MFEWWKRLVGDSDGTSLRPLREDTNDWARAHGSTKDPRPLREGTVPNPPELTLENLELDIRRCVFSPKGSGVLSTDADLAFVRQHGLAARPVLERLLRDGNPLVRWRAQTLLGSIPAPRTPECLEALADSFRNEDGPGTAMSAARNIAMLDTPEAEQFLIDMVAKGHGHNQHAAIHGLCGIDNPSQAVRRALLDALDHPMAGVRKHAMNCIRSTRWVADQIVDLLLKQTHDPAGDVRGSAAYALGSHLDKDPRVVERLRTMLDDSPSDVLFFVVSVLHGKAAAPAVPQLLGILADEEMEPRVRGFAASAIASTGLKPDGFLDAVIAALESNAVSRTPPDPMYSGHPFCDLCGALKHLKPESRRAVPLLREMLAQSWGQMCNVTLRTTLRELE